MLLPSHLILTRLLCSSLISLRLRMSTKCLGAISVAFCAWITCQHLQIKYEFLLSEKSEFVILFPVLGRILVNMAPRNKFHKINFAYNWKIITVCSLHRSHIDWDMSIPAFVEVNNLPKMCRVVEWPMRLKCGNAADFNRNIFWKTKPRGKVT
jgi:hypothetical protein